MWRVVLSSFSLPFVLRKTNIEKTLTTSGEDTSEVDRTTLVKEIENFIEKGQLLVRGEGRVRHHKDVV